MIMTVKALFTQLQRLIEVHDALIVSWKFLESLGCLFEVVRFPT